MVQVISSVFQQSLNALADSDFRTRMDYTRTKMKEMPSSFCLELYDRAIVCFMISPPCVLLTITHTVSIRVSSFRFASNRQKLELELLAASLSYQRPTILYTTVIITLLFLGLSPVLPMDYDALHSHQSSPQNRNRCRECVSINFLAAVLHNRCQEFANLVAMGQACCDDHGCRLLRAVVRA
jgi:hypothetical protein